jgi:tetratricopeptide (TPR) repeat protein
MGAGSRTIRLFLSSTFRDFGEERDLLVKRVFPALRARLKDRFVELVDVDLRWGITVEEAERGEVLPICLAEIDRARPYFIGMLGERYGWIPPRNGYAADLLERQPWLKNHQGGKSVTELEILHGVLNNRRMHGRAFFYFRSPTYARVKGGDYLPSAEDRTRQLRLKRRIRERGLSVTSYANPETLAKRIERDLWRLLDAEFPAAAVPDEFERERLRHEAYAAPRRRLYLGGERYQVALKSLLDAEEPRILVEGASGGGKSALLANFFEAYRNRHRKHLVHEHYLGASADAADPHTLVRRLIEFIQRATSSPEEIPGDPQRLMDSLPLWLATASAWARKRRTRFIFVLDALDGLIDQKDLRWWPAFLPKGITMVVSSLPGTVHDALKGKSDALPKKNKPPKWKAVTVRPLTKAQSATLLTTYLARFNKKLTAPMVRQVKAHPLSTNPLFIRTLAEELRLFGVHEELQKRLNHYLGSQTIGGLFELLLQRVEKDFGRKKVKTVMTAIWASRAGLTEKEVLAIANLTPAGWAGIRHALNEALLEAAGRISFAHDYARIAVGNRYLAEAPARLGAHRALARHFSSQPSDARRAEEEPWQWSRANAWGPLKRHLTTWSTLESVVVSRGQSELLEYWRQIELHGGGNMQSEYALVWRRWRRMFRGSSRLRAASAIQVTLEHAGYFTGLSEALAREAALGARKLLGANHRETLIAIRNLASILTNQQTPNSLVEARHLLSDMPERWRRAKDDHQAADCLNLLGSILAMLGEVAEAERAYVKALEIFSSTDGNTDPFSTAAVLNNLGDLANGIGDYEAAESRLRSCLEIRSRALSPGHPLIGLTLDNLAKAVAGQGRSSEAFLLHARALEIRELSLGDQHPDTLNSCVNWATLLFNERHFGEAATLYRRASNADERRFGKHHEFTVMDKLTLLRCLRRQLEAGVTNEAIRHKLETELAVIGEELTQAVSDPEADLAVELCNTVRSGLHWTGNRKSAANSSYPMPEND